MMVRHAGLAVCVAAFVLVPRSARAQEDPSTVRDAYLQLRDSGCDVSNTGSPLVARALRNAPYAMNGKIFKSPELTWLYEHDGGWYKPRDADADVATPKDRTCVGKLEAHEKTLRKRIKIKTAIEHALMHHPETIVFMNRTVFPGHKKIRQFDTVAGGKRTWRLEHSGDDGLVIIECTMPIAEVKAKKPNWSTLACDGHTPG